MTEEKERCAWSKISPLKVIDPEFDKILCSPRYLPIWGRRKVRGKPVYLGRLFRKKNNERLQEGAQE